MHSHHHKNSNTHARDSNTHDQIEDREQTDPILKKTTNRANPIFLKKQRKQQRNNKKHSTPNCRTTVTVENGEQKRRETERNESENGAIYKLIDPSRKALRLIKQLMSTDFPSRKSCFAFFRAGATSSLRVTRIPSAPKPVATCS